MSPLTIIIVHLLYLGVCLASGASDASDSQEVQVQVPVGRDCTLECNAKRKAGVQYLAVRWFNVRDNNRFGLVTKNLPHGATRMYGGVQREVELLDESHAIFMPNMTCGDRGLYMCYLAAPLGEQNREGFVHLTSTDCDVSTTEIELTWDFLPLFALTVLIIAFVIFLISYVCLKKTIKEKNKTIKKQIFLDAPLKPLDKKDLMSIRILGRKTPPSMKHIYV